MELNASFHKTNATRTGPSAKMLAGEVLRTRVRRTNFHATLAAESYPSAVSVAELITYFENLIAQGHLRRPSLTFEN